MSLDQEREGRVAADAFAQGIWSKPKRILETWRLSARMHPSGEQFGVIGAGMVGGGAEHPPRLIEEPAGDGDAALHVGAVDRPNGTMMPNMENRGEAAGILGRLGRHVAHVGEIALRRQIDLTLVLVPDPQAPGIGAQDQLGRGKLQLVWEWRAFLIDAHLHGFHIERHRQRGSVECLRPLEEGIQRGLFRIVGVLVAQPSAHG